MEIVAIIFLGAILNGLLASSRGRSAIVWALLGGCFPLISLLILVVMPDLRQRAQDSERIAEAEHRRRLAEIDAAQKSAADTKTCPYCAEEIKAAAVVCRFCGKEQPAQPSNKENPKMYDVPVPQTYNAKGNVDGS